MHHIISTGKSMVWYYNKMEETVYNCTLTPTISTILLDVKLKGCKSEIYLYEAFIISQQ